MSHAYHQTIVSIIDCYILDIICIKLQQHNHNGNNTCNNKDNTCNNNSNN